MAKKKFEPENRNDRDYFDTPATEALMVLQEEKIIESSQRKNFVEDLDLFSDQKNQLCFCGFL